MAATTPPSMSVNFASPEVNRDPFPVLAEIREEAPVVFNPLIEHWLVGRYAEARHVAGDEAHFAPDRKFFDDIFGARVFEADDNPRHNETRGVWNPSFRRPAVEARRDVIERIVNECLADVTASLRNGETVDAVPRFALLVPSLVISEMLGVAHEDIPRFVRWAQEMNLIAESVVEGPTPRAAQLRETGVKAQKAMCAFAGRELEVRRREERDDDLIGLMALSPVASERSEDELRAAIAQLVLAGHETTGKLLGHMLIILGRHREQLDAIREDRTLIPQAVEELIRFAGVIGAQVRTARVDVEVAGIPIPAGDPIMTLPTAANRDPRRWDDPDTFDIFREPKAHLGFGFGTHVCLGLSLARLEAQIALDKVLDALPDFRLAQSEFDYGTNWFLRGPRAVEITL